MIRFGELCWRKVAEDELSTDMCATEKFAKQAFESASSYFYTRYKIVYNYSYIMII